MNASPNKRDARWARTRQALLEGGRKVFARQGVEATTVLDIVRAAGVSQPSFYNHFDSKDALATEIATDFFRADRAAKQAVFASVDDPAEAIAINVCQTLAVATEDPVIAWTLIKSETLRNLVISSKTDPLAEMLSTGMQSGRFASADAHTIALSIRGGALAVMQDILNNKTADDSARAYPELVLRMLGLSPAESTEIADRAYRKTILAAAA